MTIEVEIKSFITKVQFDRLHSFFLKNATFLYQDNQETCYFTGDKDIRSQKNTDSAKIIFKKGRVHDQQRAEVEVRVLQEDYENIQAIFNELGLVPEIIWYRKRLAFKWQDIDVCLDHTKGYGYILEMEKLSDKKRQDPDLAYLKAKLADLNITLTPREEFEKAFAYYRANWRSLTK